MYEIVMSSGDRGECETILACFTAAATMYDDSEDKNTRVAGVYLSVEGVNPIALADLRAVLNRHLLEARPVVA